MNVQGTVVAQNKIKKKKALAGPELNFFHFVSANAQKLSGQPKKSRSYSFLIYFLGAKTERSSPHSGSGPLVLAPRNIKKERNLFSFSS